MHDMKKFHNRFYQIIDICAQIYYIRERDF